MPTSGERLAECARLRAARDHGEDALRIEILGALHVSGEVRVLHRHAYRSDDLAAGVLEAFLERAFGVDARTVVGDHGVGVFQPVLRRPGAERLRKLRHGERGAHHVRRLGGDDRGGGVHDHHVLLGFGGNVGGGHCVGGQQKAGEDIDVVARHQFLRQPLGDRRSDAAGVLADDLDLHAAEHVAMLLEIELDRIIHLGRAVGELPGIRHDQADLDRSLGVAGGRQQAHRQR